MDYYNGLDVICQEINRYGNQNTRNILKPSLKELGCPTTLFITKGSS